MEKIVVDIGCGTTKVGYSGDEQPRIVFPTIVGPIKNRLKGYIAGKLGINDDTLFIGDEALQKRGLLRIKHPIDTTGTEVDYKGLTSIWEHIYLKKTSSDKPLLMTSLPIMRNSDFEKMSEILFETIGVPSLQIADSSVLSMFTHSNKSGTGVVLDSGYGCSKAISMINYLPIHESHTRMIGKNYLNESFYQCIGGNRVTDYLVKILSERGYEFTTSGEKMIVNDMKESMCFVSSDYKSELRRHATEYREYVLPDGSKMELGAERFRAPEILFKPSFVGLSPDISVQKLVKNSICKSCEEEKKKNLKVRRKEELLKNIILSGGTTLISGFEDRLRIELQKEFGFVENKNKSYYKNNNKNDNKKKKKDDCGPIRIHAHPKRRFAGWMGGSILSNLSSFKFVEKGMMKEYGLMKHFCRYAVCDLENYFSELRSGMEEKKLVDIVKEDIRNRAKFILEGGDGPDDQMVSSDEDYESQLFTISCENVKIGIHGFLRFLL